MERLRLRAGDPLRLGVNYRLAYGWDFVPPPGGTDLSLHNPARRDQAKRDFQEIRNLGATVIRWFALNDLRGGTVLRNGQPVAPEPAFLEGLLLGLDTAAEAGLSVLLVLLDHTVGFPNEPTGAGEMNKQGFGELLRSGPLFEEFSGQVLEPVIRATVAHPAILGYELVNEPEMLMRRRDHWYSPVTGAGAARVPAKWRLRLDEMRARMAHCARIVHGAGDAHFSIGSMSSRWVSQWMPLLDPARDLLTFHYYAQDDERDLEKAMIERIDPLTSRLAVGLGEFYPCGAAVQPVGRRPWPDISLSQFFDAARRHRLQLAMPWVWNQGLNDPRAIPVAEWANYLDRNRDVLLV